MLQKGSNITHRATVNFTDDEVKWSSSKSYLEPSSNQLRKPSPDQNYNPYQYKVNPSDFYTAKFNDQEQPRNVSYERDVNNVSRSGGVY